MKELIVEDENAMKIDESEIEPINVVESKLSRFLTVDGLADGIEVDKLARMNAEEANEVIMRFQTPVLDGVEILPPPPTLKAKLHDYQQQGISWMIHMFKQGMPMILGDQVSY